MAAFLLRIGFGMTMFLSHGYPKLVNFSAYSENFPDPFGLGGPLSLALTVFAETLCALLVTCGIFTRIASLPVLIAMATAFFIIHGADPWAKKELAFVYMLAYAVIFIAGPGSYGLGTKVNKSTSWISQ